MPAQSGSLCARCGEALEGDSAADVEPLCRPCRMASPPFEKASAWGVYRDELRALLHLFKYDGMVPLAKRLGVLLAESIVAIPDLTGDVVIVPVPLFGSKYRQRGFNQAELLARSAMAVAHGRRPELRMRLVPALLTRTRFTDSQANLTPRQRRINVRGAFSALHPELVKGRQVLLVDDIYTTGATARACSLALRRAGAERVWVATVARAQKEMFPQRAVSAQPAEIPMRDDVAFWGSESRAD